MSALKRNLRSGITRLSEREELSFFYTQKGIVIADQLARDFAAFRIVDVVANVEVDAGEE
jgi:hypothetical protein